MVDMSNDEGMPRLLPTMMPSVDDPSTRLDAAMAAHELSESYFRLMMQGSGAAIALIIVALNGVEFNRDAVATLTGPLICFITSLGTTVLAIGFSQNSGYQAIALRTIYRNETSKNPAYAAPIIRSINRWSTASGLVASIAMVVMIIAIIWGAYAVTQLPHIA